MSNSFNRARVFFNCPPNCPTREPGCQDRCERYLEKRAAWDEMKARERVDRGITSYVCDAVIKNMDATAKARKNRAGIRRMPG